MSVFPGGSEQYAMAQAIKASGAIVEVLPADFESVVSRQADPLVVVAESGFFRKQYRYLLGHKGLIFYTKSDLPLDFSRDVEVIAAKRIWVPQ
jgi:hypothetical protein